MMVKGIKIMLVMFTMVEVADLHSLLVHSLGRMENQAWISKPSFDNIHGIGSGTSQGPNNQSNNSSVVRTYSYSKKPGHTISQYKHLNFKFFNRGSVENRTFHSKKLVSTCNIPSSSQIFQPFIQTGHVSLGKTHPFLSRFWEIQLQYSQPSSRMLCLMWTLP